MKLLTTIIAIALTSNLSAEQIPHFTKDTTHLLPNVVKGSVVSIEGRFRDLQRASLGGVGGSDMKTIERINKTFNYMIEADPTITPFDVHEVLVMMAPRKSGKTAVLIVLIENKEELNRLMLSLKSLLDIADRDGVKLTELDLQIEGTYAGSTKSGASTVLRGEILIRTTPRIN